MPSFIVPAVKVTVLSGQTQSNALIAHDQYDDAIALTIVAPDDMQGAISSLIEVLRNPEEEIVANFTFVGYEEGESGSTVAVTGPIAGTARSYFNLATTPGFRIVVNAPVVADIDFLVFKQMGVTY